MFIVYRDPQTDYESFIERFCLRQRKLNINEAKKVLVDKAISFWKSESLSKNKEKLNQFLELKDGEKKFIR